MNNKTLFVLVLAMLIPLGYIEYKAGLKNVEAQQQLQVSPAQPIQPQLPVQPQAPQQQQPQAQPPAQPQQRPPQQRPPQQRPNC